MKNIGYILLTIIDGIAWVGGFLFGVMFIVAMLNGSLYLSFTGN